MYIIIVTLMILKHSVNNVRLQSRAEFEESSGSHVMHTPDTSVLCAIPPGLRRGLEELLDLICGGSSLFVVGGVYHTCEWIITFRSRLNFTAAKVHTTELP